MCPTCGTTLELSNAPAANQIRRFVRERAAAGDSKGEIKDKLVTDFGPGVLAFAADEGLRPARVGAAAARGRCRRRGAGRAQWSAGAAGASRSLAIDEQSPTAAPSLDPALEKRLEEELARFE